MSTKHSKASASILADMEKTARHDATFWGVRVKRDTMSHTLPEWEQLREAADKIKKHTVTHLDRYLEQFEANAVKNGAIVHWAKDAQEYNRIVLDILTKHNVRKVVKAKSMLTEECGLNQNLQKNDIEVVETDLGERILQLMKLAPGHIIMPAIHITRQQVRDCFREQGMLVNPSTDDEQNADPTYLTHCARLSLRNSFLTAQCGMTGANFGIASTGEIVVCTNEGNADMSTSIPNLHIASIGIEKIIPDYKALGLFHRLLARHGTGQATTVYTSHFKKPRPGGEFHIIIVDNGRSEILSSKDHWQTLKCMRCGACMNTCPVFRRSTGYSYTYFIPGPIGINLGMLKDKDANYHNLSACSLCCSCDNVCPVRVDLSTQIYKWRQNLDRMGHADKTKKLISKGMAFMFDRPSVYEGALKLSHCANFLPPFIKNHNPWGCNHAMPHFAKKSFHQLWKEGKVK